MENIFYVNPTTTDSFVNYICGGGRHTIITNDDNTNSLIFSQSNNGSSAISGEVKAGESIYLPDTFITNLYFKTKVSTQYANFRFWNFGEC